VIHSGHNTTHISARLTILLAMVCLAPQCFSESKVLNHTISLDGLVDDADISPDGEYTAVAVRTCGRSGGSRTCTHNIELWTSGDTKQVTSRVLLTNVTHDVTLAVRFSADGHSIFMSDGQGKLRQWQMTDLAEIKSMDIGLASEDIQQLEARDKEERPRLYELTNRVRHAPEAVQIEPSPSSPLVAVVIRVGAAKMIRVFDLTSDKLLYSWSFLDAGDYGGPPALSWSHDGKRIAVSLPSARGLKHPGRTDPADLLIYDVVSGQLTTKFETKNEMERAVFAGDDLIVSTSRMPGTFFRPKLRVLDSRTGDTIRTISAEETGVRRPVAISTEGNVILGFVGHVRKAMLWSDLVSMDVPMDVRIRLWEMPTGNLIFASEDLPLNPKRALSFRLNATGNWVLGFEHFGGTNKLLLLQLK
jgi:WD40 repeat protein